MQPKTESLLSAFLIPNGVVNTHRLCKSYYTHPAFAVKRLQIGQCVDRDLRQKPHQWRGF